MVHLLSKEKFIIVEQFLTSPHLELCIRPVIEGSFQGMIWVDDLKKPTLFYLWDTRFNHFLGGDTHSNNLLQKLKAILSKHIVPHLKEQRNYFCLNHSEQWDSFLSLSGDDIFPRHVNVSRLLFRLEEIKYPDWRSLVPQSISIEPVTKELITQTRLKNINGLLHELKHMWGDIDNFFSYGFGYCARTETALAGWCLGEYYTENVNPRKFGIGLETYPEFQRQNIATIMTSALLEKGRECGYDIYWDCSRANIASVKTAQKTGFILVQEYDEYQGKFNQSV